MGQVRTLFQRSPIMTDTEPFRDGKRFLINRVIEPSEKDPLTLVVNWDAEIKKR